jgi:outer membrane protein assembly factor BamB
MRCLFALLLAAACSSQALADNWPQWRGPLGTGVSSEKTAPLEWSATKNVLWEADMPGPGNSTPIIWGDKLFLTGASADGKKRGTYCFDVKTGDGLWANAIEYVEAEPTHNTNPPCSASPVTDGERVIAWHGSAGMFCYDLDGKLLWKKDIGKFEHVWGNAASPVIYKDLVILNAGPGLNVAVIGLDKKTGNDVWRKEYPGMKSEKLDEFRGSWSTPVVYNDGQRDVLLLSLPEKLRAVDPLSGEEFWTCDGPSKLFYTSPLIAGDVIVVMSGYHGPAMAVRGGGAGDVTATHRLWLHTEKIPQRVGSGVVVDGKVYILNEDGVAWCIDAVSGEIHWKERLGGQSWGSAVAVGDTIYFANMTGQTTVIKASAAKCDVLAKNALTGKTMRASPAINNGRIFLRDYEKLYCIESFK